MVVTNFSLDIYKNESPGPGIIFQKELVKVEKYSIVLNLEQ